MNIFIILIFFLIAVFSFRFEFVFHSDNMFLSNVGFAVLHFFSIAFFLYASSIWLSALDSKNRFFMKISFSFIVALSSLLIFSFYNMRVILTDTILFVISSVYLILMTIYGDYVFSSLIKLRPLKEGELEKAFLTYPPKSYFDFVFFYIFMSFFMLMPLIVGKYWGLKS